MITNVLSVDVEEYFHAGIFRAATRASGPRTFESRVEGSVERLLALLADHGARATFFVLGEIAALHPALVRTMAAASHEIACHGNAHEDVHRQSPVEFRADIRMAKKRIEDVTGSAIVGYRAPNFSIGHGQRWAYEILIEEGFRYDSSLYPILHDRYGQATAPRFPYLVSRGRAGSLVEFPIGTTRVLGANLPIGGGGYFRLLPFGVSRWGIARVNTSERRPVMFYLHPWELDPEQPRPPMSWRHRWRHYVGIAREAEKLDRLFEWFRFGTAREALETYFSLDPLPWPAALRGEGPRVPA